MSSSEPKQKLKFEISNVNVNSKMFSYILNDGRVSTKYPDKPINVATVSNFTPYTLYNLIYNSDGADSAYKSTEIMFLKPMHKTFTDKTNKTVNVIKASVKVDGEFIIKFNNNNNNANLYLCFFYVFDSAVKDSGLSNIMSALKNKIGDEDNFLKDMDFQLPTKQTEPANVYTTIKNDTFIVLTEPIKINVSDSQKINLLVANLKPELTISKNTKTDVKIDPKNITSLSQDDIYIDCSPTGATKETIDTYNLPINSDYMQNAQSVGMMRMVVNMLMCFFGLILIYALFPWFYREQIYEKLERAYIDANEFKTKLDSVDVMYTILVFLFIVMVLPTGIVEVQINGTSAQGWFSIWVACFVFFIYSITNFLAITMRIGKNTYTGFKLFDANVWNSIVKDAVLLFSAWKNRNWTWFDQGFLFTCFAIVLIIIPASVSGAIYAKNMPEKELTLFLINLIFMSLHGIVAYFIFYYIFFLKSVPIMNAQ